MARAIKTVPEMTEELKAERDKDGYSRKLYKAQSDEHKGDMLAADIMMRADDLLQSEERGKVDLSSLDDVQRRTYDYFTACANAQTYPSIMGLAVHGFGISRQALNQWLNRNAGSRVAEFISKAKDVMADILTNASLYNNANAVQVIFQLKNHFEHSDRVEVQPVAADSPMGARWSMTDDECIQLIKSHNPDRDVSGMTDAELHSEALSIKYSAYYDLPD